MRQILESLSPGEIKGCQAYLDMVQRLGKKQGEPVKPKFVVDAVSRCIHKKLAASLLFLAAERTEASPDKEMRKWTPVFDWMRHTLAANDVEQLPEMAQTVEFLTERKFKSACQWAEMISGLNNEFAEIVRLWRNS